MPLPSTFCDWGLPDSINSLVGRLVGYVELQKGPANRTDLDVPPAFRNDVLRSKKVLIGCGGGYHQECSQPYSPVAKWIEEVDAALNDEGQQYGNLDEASAMARTPRKCIIIWCGDHKQTPGGLRKTEEAKAFRRKLLRRPIALRGATEYIQPNLMGKVVLRYLDDVNDPVVKALRTLLLELLGDVTHITGEGMATLQMICREVGCEFQQKLCSSVFCTAVVVLWLALHQDRFPLLANTLEEAAGLAGTQKWALILPSSARVSFVTYTTVIAVRYPELDSVQDGITVFGNYLVGTQSTHGGFLPVFWNAPTAYMHAATDIGCVVEWIQSQFDLTTDENGCLAVLHNRNHMVTTFGNSEWVTQSSGQVQSKSVTSCAGMTAHLVLLAQTRVGFLSGGRGKRMRELSTAECAAQLEEAFARATVALTLAQRLCLIMGPLDMKGLLGAATVIGCLKYGAGLCGFNPDQRDVCMHLRETDIGKGPDDAAFLLSLQKSISNDRGVYPPLALAEIYRNDVSTQTKIRRLHLLVVDLERTKCVSDEGYWQFQKAQVSTCYLECFNTLPVPIADAASPVRCRYVYGYGVDASDRPSYLLWPCRGSDGHFWLMDPRSGKFFDPAKASFIAQLGLKHFFDAFALEHQRDIRVDAAHALELDVEDILPNLVVKQEVAQQFKLTPVPLPVDPPAKKAKKMTKEESLPEAAVPLGDVNMDKDSAQESESDTSDSNSDFSSEDGSSDVSDLDKFEEAFKEFGKLTAGVDPASLDRQHSGHTNDDVAGLPLRGGFTTLQSLANVPKTWPLARLTVPLSGFSKHLERLLEGFCLEVYATNANPDEQLGSIKSFAKDLVLALAFHLAERIASLLRQVLDHPTKVLYDPETEVLFLPQVWLFPIYRELLNTASRNRPSKNSEVRRAASGLVKVLCTAQDCSAGKKGSRKGKPLKQGGALTKFNDWFGSMSLMNTLYVWFPASWGPSVVEAISKRNQKWLQQNPVHRDPAMFNSQEVQNATASRDMRYKIQKWNVNSDKVHPILVANARVDWLFLDDSDITQQFEILREGILRDVFSQRASSAWQGMQPQRLTVSLLLPCMNGEADEWLDFMQCQRQFWPTMTTRHASLVPLELGVFRRERRLMQSKHLWDTLNIDWHKVDAKLYNAKPTGHSRELLWNHLFVQKHRQNPFQEREYQGHDAKNVYNKWYADRRHMKAYQSTKTLRGIDVDATMMRFNIENLTAKQALMDAKEKHARRWQTKEGTYRLKEKLLPDVRDTDVEMIDSSTAHQ